MSQKKNVFVSYSHTDAPLVGPVVKLLRLNRSLVFQDVDSIRPGKKWREEIADALADSHLVVVFWCGHASESSEVTREWEAAIEQDKDLLPLLLDGTPLPAELSEFQWIDFRGTVGDSHGSAEAPPQGFPGAAPAPQPVQQSKGRPVRWWSLAAVTVTLVAALGLFTLQTPKEAVRLPPIGSAPPHTRSLPAPTSPRLETRGYVLNNALLVVIGATVVGAVTVTWWLRRRRRYRRQVEDLRSQAGPMGQRMASEVEAEIVRRTKAGPARTVDSPKAPSAPSSG